MTGNRSTLLGDDKTTRGRIILYGILFVFLLTAALTVDETFWLGSPRLHGTLEIVATLLAFIIGIVALLRFYSKKNNMILFISMGFLGTAFFDGYHSLTTLVGEGSQGPGPALARISWSWNASRIFLSQLLFLSWFTWKQEEKLGQKGRINERDVYAAIGVLTLLIFLAFTFIPLPRTYFPGFFLGRPVEWVAAIFFLIAGYGYFQKGTWKQDQFEHWLILSILIGFMCQALFMPFSKTYHDSMFNMAHLLKITSYLCVLAGLLNSMYELFRQAEESKQILAEKNQSLEESKEELESVNQELKDFAYIVSHDLKAPLRAIGSLTNWIVTDYADSLDEDGKEQLNLLGGRVQRMHALIDGILQYSRVGRVREESKDLELNSLVEEVIEILAAPEHINVSIAKPLPTIRSEQTRITQLFQNLIGNAIKYMDKPKGNITVDCVSQDGRWKFSVADNGPGIEEKYYEKVFKIFQTLTARDVSESTGVGLSIVKKIVTMYGGEVWVESQVGKGTTFFFTLPQETTE